MTVGKVKYGCYIIISPMRRKPKNGVYVRNYNIGGEGNQRERGTREMNSELKKELKEEDRSNVSGIKILCLSAGKTNRELEYGSLNTHKHTNF